MTHLYLHLSSGDFQQWSIGKAFYLPDHPVDSSLLIAVRCRFGDQVEEQLALFDTGSEWSFCRKEIADLIGLSASNGLPKKMHTRFGLIDGFLNRCDITFIAEGEEISIDATFFVSEEWPGPNVIGWKGCLESIKFALDPQSNMIFYGRY